MGHTLYRVDEKWPAICWYTSCTCSDSYASAALAALASRWLINWPGSSWSGWSGSVMLALGVEVLRC
jgi:hypothetical protein